MKAKSKLRNVIVIIALVGALIPACILFNTEKLPSVLGGATATATSTETATLTPSPQPTNTPVPSETPTQPPPSDTPAVVDTQAPEVPTRTESSTGEQAHVKLINRLGVSLKIKLRGAELKTVTVLGGSSMEFDIAPGTYDYTLSATGYLPSTGTKTFESGDNTWTIGHD